MRRIFILLCLLMVWAESALAAGNLGVLWDWQAPGEKESRLVQQAKLPGIDVLSPSWFIIENAQGKIKTRHGSVKYVRQAHNKGYQVWALITNNFDPQMTSKLLRRQKHQTDIYWTELICRQGTAQSRSKECI